ncbi:MAG: YraN family protein, partial [Christensenellales bacterium]
SRYLRKKGYKIIERNFKCGAGEIDIVAQKDKTIVFVEVKRRDNGQCGFGNELISEAKLKKVVNASIIYLKKKCGANYSIRYDLLDLGDDGDIVHIEAIM